MRRNLDQFRLWGRPAAVTILQAGFPIISNEDAVRLSVIVQ